MVTSRRGWGDGAVYRRQRDGLWVGTVELGRDHRGRRRRQAVYGRTKREALEKLNQARQSKCQGLEPMDQRLTVGEWLDTWLVEYTAELSPGAVFLNVGSVVPKRWVVWPLAGLLRPARPGVVLVLAR